MSRARVTIGETTDGLDRNPWDARFRWDFLAHREKSHPALNVSALWADSRTGWCGYLPLDPSLRLWERLSVSSVTELVCRACGSKDVETRRHSVLDHYEYEHRCRTCGAFDSTLSDRTLGDAMREASKREHEP